MTEHKSDDLKKVAVEYFLEHPEKTQEEIAEIYQTSVRSLLRWVEKYETMEGEIKRLERPAVAYKVKEEHVKYIVECLSENKFLTMKDLLALLKTKYPDLDISRFHLSRLVRQELITLKLKRHLHEPVTRFGKEVNIKSQIKEFYDKVSKFKLEDIICLDETSISGLLKRNFCYSEKGTRCVHKTTSQAVFKKYTGIFAISTSGIVAYDVYEKGGIDSDRLEKFIDEFIAKNKFKKKLIIMDNASSHKKEKIQEIVNKDNTILYTPVYQHSTNAIENYFSVLKSKLKKLDNLSYEQIKENIAKAVIEIPKEHYYNIIKGTYDRTPKPEQKKKKSKTPKKIYKK